MQRLAALLVGLAAQIGAGHASLVEASSLAPRSLACLGRDGAVVAKNAWEAARAPSLRVACDLLARGLAELHVDPSRAAATADEVEAAAPGSAAADVLRARARLALGDAPGSAAAFERVRERAPAALEDAATRHDWGLALARTDRRDAALEVMRLVVAAVESLPSREARARAWTDAGALSLAFGPELLDEALGRLEAARALDARPASLRARALLALGLSRAERDAEAAEVVAEIAVAGGLAALERAPASAAPAEDLAASAFVAETLDPRGASARWAAYRRAASIAPAWAAQAAKRGARTAQGRRRDAAR